MFVGAVVVAEVLMPIRTDSPTPGLQCWIPLVAILLTSVFVRRHNARAAFLVMQVVLAVLLQVQFYDLGDRRGSPWTGWSDPNRHLSHYRKMALLHLSFTVRDAAVDLPKKVLPAGWIDREPLRSALLQDYPDELLSADCPTGIDTAHAVWHTWLTGLWHVERRPAGVWYPGGTPAEAADRLELRPR